MDFVLEALDGRTLPIEVEFRRRVEPDDYAAVPRDRFEWRPTERLLLVPLTTFLLAF